MPFSSSKDDSDSESSSDSVGTRWWVPLTFEVSGRNVAQPENKWLDPSETSTVIMKDKPTDAWIIANLHQTGFYRVNYDEHNWKLLADMLKNESTFSDVSVLNRAQILDDAMSLARAGLLEYSLALELTRYLRLETDPIPWTAALGHLSFLGKMLSGTEAHEAFQNLRLELLNAVYQDVGFQEQAADSHIKLTFRASLMGEACGLGLEDCVGNATTTFKAFKSGTTVPPSVRSTVYCVGMRQGTAADWDWLWERYTNTTTAPGERSLILGALGCSKNNATLSKYLGYSLKENLVRPQDASAVFGAVLSGDDANLDLAFDFFQTNFKEMNKKYGGWSSMQNVVGGLANRMLDETKLKKLEDFLAENSADLGVAEAAAERSLETARSNLAWRTTNLRSVEDWVLNRQGDGANAAPSALGLGLPHLLAVVLILTGLWAS